MMRRSFKGVKYAMTALCVGILASLCAVVGVAYAETPSTYASFAMQDGAAVRIMEDEHGLRFITSIGKADYDALVAAADGAEIEFGAIAAPQGETLTLENANATKIVSNGWYKEFTPDSAIATEYKYASVLSNITDYDKEYDCVGYAKYGSTVIYSAKADNVRSLRSVAFMACADAEDGALADDDRATLAGKYLTGITVAGRSVSAYEYEKVDGSSLKLVKAQNSGYDLRIASNGTDMPTVTIKGATIDGEGTYSINVGIDSADVDILRGQTSLAAGTGNKEIVFVTDAAAGLDVKISSANGTLGADTVSITEYKAITIDSEAVELIGNTTVNGTARTGESKALTATVTDKDDNVKNIDVNWSVDSRRGEVSDGNLSIDENGNLTAGTPIYGEITVKAALGNLQASCAVRVAYAISSREDLNALAFATMPTSDKYNTRLVSHDYLYKLTANIDYGNKVMYPIAAGNDINKTLTDAQKAEYGDDIMKEYFENTANGDVKPSYEGMYAWYNLTDEYNTAGTYDAFIVAKTELPQLSKCSTAADFVKAGGFNPGKYRFAGTIDGNGHSISNAYLMINAYKGNPYIATENNNNYDACTNFIGSLSGTLKNIGFKNLQMMRREYIRNYYNRLVGKKAPLQDLKITSDNYVKQFMKDQVTMFSGLCGSVSGKIENVYLEFTYSLYTHNAAYGSGTLAFRVTDNAEINNCVVKLTKTSDGVIKLDDARSFAPAVSLSLKGSSAKVNNVYVQVPDGINDRVVNYGVIRANDGNSAVVSNSGVYKEANFLSTANFSDFDSKLWNLTGLDANGHCTALPTLKAQ